MAEDAARRSLAGRLPADAADRGRRLNRKQFIVSAAGCLVAILLLPGFGHAQTDKVRTMLAVLIERTGKLGVPHIEGRYPVGGKHVPGLYFGHARMNNVFDVVDEVAKEQAGAVALFVKAGDEYVRVATNMRKTDGSRAVGTVLDPNSPAMTMIRKGEAYYGEAMILGKPYVVGYEPIRDYTPQRNVIGIYFVGAVK